jgi:hypothetical protein
MNIILPCQSHMQNQCFQAIIIAAGPSTHTFASSAIAFSKPLFNKTPYHTSILTGEGWVLKLLNSHPT